MDEHNPGTVQVQAQAASFVVGSPSSRGCAVGTSGSSPSDSVRLQLGIRAGAQALSASGSQVASSGNIARMPSMRSCSTMNGTTPR